MSLKQTETPKQVPQPNLGPDRPDPIGKPIPGPQPAPGPIKNPPRPRPEK